MDADEFKRVLSQVIREELGVGVIDISGRWEGGEMILKPGKEGLQEKRIPLDSLFHKNRHDPRPLARPRAEDQHPPEARQPTRRSSFSST